MDHVTIEEGNVLERYLLGQLAADAAESFEDHYLDCPECLEKLELGRRLRDGLRDVAAEEGASLVQTALLAWLVRRGRGLQAALAVTLLTVVILPWALLGPRVSRLAGERERLASELTQSLAPQVGTPSYFLSPERSGPGEAPSTRITLGPSPEWIVLVLQPPPTANPVRYQVRLRQAGGEPLWQRDQLAPDASGQVTLNVHSSWLAAADYVVELEVLTPEGAQPVAGFAFRVRREP